MQLKTNKPDFHLIYTKKATNDIIVQKHGTKNEIILPHRHSTFTYIPRSKFDILLKPGNYLVYGLLIDIGLVRDIIYHHGHFLSELKNARKRDKSSLYQTALWPIKELTDYQLNRIETIFFNYSKQNEAKVIEQIYQLFDIAESKQFVFYEKLSESQILAKEARTMIHDIVNQGFQEVNISLIATILGVSDAYLGRCHKRYYRQTLLQYRDEILLPLAKDRLLSVYTIGEVANFCGFKVGIPYLFKHYYGIALRKISGGSIALKSYFGVLIFYQRYVLGYGVKFRQNYINPKIYLAGFYPYICSILNEHKHKIIH